MNEDQRVRALAAIFASSLHGVRAERAGEGVRVGIGDDAAVIDTDLVWTVDAQVEGTHFERAWLSWEDVGWRSFMAAASDLAAMGAAPLAALSALVLAPDVDDDALVALARGQREASDALGLPIVGGNLARGTETSITTSVIGRSKAPILRSGAKAGDMLLVAGALGLAGVGLAALQREDRNIVQSAAIAAWRRPRARILDGLAMAAVAHAAIDVSDGLALDASRMAEMSNVEIVLDRAALALHGGDVPLDLVLGGGEDYALLVASPIAIEGFTCIGRVDDGNGLWLDEGGSVRPVEPTGFDHFSR